MLTKQDVLDKIIRGETFEGELEDGSLTLHIHDYQPYIATAIHHGGKLRPSLQSQTALDKEERYFEEDPYTGDFIASLPIVLRCNDSRYEYDLNRPPENCIYKDAWGKNVWLDELTEEELFISRQKHAQYYEILAALINVLEKKHNVCVVYDIHSYNFRRITRDTPTFNLGLSQVNRRKWYREVSSITSLLADIQLPNLETSIGINDVFEGKGYQATFIKEHFHNTLILPLEVKKIYMDETSGEAFPIVIDELKQAFKQVISEHIAYVINVRSRRKSMPASQVLPSHLGKEVTSLDSRLYRLAKDLSTLKFINPVNLKQEKRNFLRRPYEYQPVFRYRQLDIDPYGFKEKLYRLPVEDIRDADIQILYKHVIDQLAKRIDLITTVGSEEFKYNSLRYYGQPSKNDMDNANFILHAHDWQPDEKASIPASDAITTFKQAAIDLGLKCKIQSSDKIVAHALVDDKSLKINSSSMFSMAQLQGLIHHELGLHILTSINADHQPLKVLKLGLPGNTYTQEGLALLMEYLSGNLSMSRLKMLALRVLAVNAMASGQTFNETFYLLKHNYDVDDDTAFNLTTRVWRGGGFTKDYLYLKGLRVAFSAWREGDISSLLIGKTGFEWKSVIDELIAREILQKPVHIPLALQAPEVNDQLVNYVISSIH